PSDGMRAHFPQYDYADMVSLQHELVEKGLGVNHLRLAMGTSMGCMNSWVWGETYPDFMDAMMPLACLPAQIAGRNRMMRKMAMDAIRQDSAWQNGEYQSPPGLKTALEVLLVMGSSPLEVQIKRVPKGKYVLLPISDQTRGHGTHTLPAIWKDYFQELLRQSQP